MSGLAITALLGTAGLSAWLFRSTTEPVQEPSPTAPPADAPSASAMSGPPSVARGAPDAATSTLGDLPAQSETFRNTSLLIAVRDAGFVCDDVAAAHKTGEGVWTVSCEDMGGYAISETSPGTLVVKPVLHFFDAPPPPDLRLERDLPLDPRRFR